MTQDKLVENSTARTSFAEVTCRFWQAFAVRKIKLKAGTSINHALARLNELSAEMKPSAVYS
jgi:hypothetical protein